VRCYGDADLALEGIVLPIGIYSPYLVTEPQWLGMPRWTQQAIVDEARVPSITLVSFERGIARPSSWGGPDLWIVVDPATGIDLAAYDKQVVQVIGHFDDPMAPTCHWVGGRRRRFLGHRGRMALEPPAPQLGRLTRGVYFGQPGRELTMSCLPTVAPADLNHWRTNRPLEI
jgi:hypothetical protein